MTVLTTRRLVLRPPESKDVGVIAELANDYEISSQTAAIPYPLTEDDVREWMEDIAQDVSFMLIHREQLVGNITAKHIDNETARLSYWLAKDWWGQGLMSEAAGTFINHLFDVHSYSAIHADRAHDNPASGRVLEKLGFRLIGPVGCFSKARDEDVPCLEYRLERKI